MGRMGPRAWEPGASDARAVCEGRVHLPGAHLRGGMRVAEPLGEERGPQGSPARGRQGAAGRAGRAWARADRGRCPCGLLAQHSSEGCAWEELVVPRGAVSHVEPHST